VGITDMLLLPEYKVIYFMTVNFISHVMFDMSWFVDGLSSKDAGSLVSNVAVLGGSRTLINES
jgi:hypothetical protein